MAAPIPREPPLTTATRVIRYLSKVFFWQIFFGPQSCFMWHSSRVTYHLSGRALPKEAAIRAASSPKKGPVKVRDWLLPHSAKRRRLFFGGLNLGDCAFDRFESFFGEVGIEFARFRYISNEPLEKRLGIFGLNLNGALKRLGAEQLFEESGTVLERLFRILARFGGDRLPALG